MGTMAATPLRSKHEHHRKDLWLESHRPMHHLREVRFLLLLPLDMAGIALVYSNQKVTLGTKIYFVT